jgi:hypothetical protein
MAVMGAFLGCLFALASFGFDVAAAEIGARDNSFMAYGLAAIYAVAFAFGSIVFFYIESLA